MSSEKKVTITSVPNGPFLVKGLTNFTNQKGSIKTEETIALCRCGGSANKPFCDGTHNTNGFSSEKLEGRVEDKRDNYEGKQITIHDNRGVCSHAGHCTDNLPAVWRMKEEPWIDPDAATVDEIVAAINKCPSGALSYSIEDKEQRDRPGDPAVFVSKDGPYQVSGGPEMDDTEFGQDASKEHYALCRCGGSKNKPFCDGTHWYIKFKDDQN